LAKAATVRRMAGHICKTKVFPILRLHRVVNEWAQIVFDEPSQEFVEM
jgi:hypothetical protein